MATFKIDSDKINRELIPLADKQIDQLNTTLNYANNLSFPYNEFDWGYVKNGLRDCIDLSKKYSQWIRTVNSSFINDSTKSVESLTSFNVHEVRKKGVIVK